MQYSPASQDAANLLGATIQKARKKFFKHSVILLSEANFDAQLGMQGPVLQTTESSLSKAALTATAASRRK